MMRVLLLGMLMSPLAALAECKAGNPEPFKRFIDSFSRDQNFAATRTEYPLTLIKHEDDGKQDRRVPIKTSVEKSVDMAQPTMAVYARDNELEIKTVSLKKTEAIVRLAKPGTDSLIFDHHFVRKGACWYLRRVEDHSIS